MNALGEKVLVVDAIQGVVGFQYDAAGNLVKSSTADYFDIINPVPSVDVEMEYDDYGRKVKTIDPDKGTWRYAYNAFGELVEQEDAKGQTSVMTYDKLGRMRTRKEYDLNGNLREDGSWTYDESFIPGWPDSLGKLTSSRLISSDAAGVEIGDELKGYIYDGAGRSRGTSSTLEINGVAQPPFIETQTYDEHGRIFQHFDMAGSDRGTQNVYNSRGYLDIVKEAFIDPDIGQVVYIDNQSMDALGNVTSHLLGNRIVTREFKQHTGRLHKVESNKANDFASFDRLTVEYDVLGNLEYRWRESANVDVKERYCYDDLNRLTKTYTGQLTGTCTGEDTTYSSSGNILTKGDQEYDYVGTSGGPHAVKKLTTPAGITNYLYDLNGNMTDAIGGGDDREFTYSVFNKLAKVERGTGTDSLEFTYGIDRQRNYRVETISGVTTKTFYMGSAERVEVAGEDTEIRRRIGGEVLVIETLGGNDDVRRESTIRRYQLLDHLGSPIAVYDNNALPTERLSIGSWGGRRDYDTLAALATIASVTTRGYTGHEHGDAFGIIHMNGRIYDPKLGRMLQADPFIQFPENTQSYNRYSYVLNNPLTHTDPSGYFVKQLVRGGIGAVLAAAGFVACGPPCAGAVASYDSWLQGAELNDALINGVATAAFSAIASPDFVDLVPSGVNVDVARGLTAGAVGGFAASAQGGKFGHGFISAGVAGGLAGSINGVSLGGNVTADIALRTVIRSLLGGTISEVTGGKFANGAATAAFASIVAESVAASRSNSFDPISPDVAVADVETAQIELNVDATLIESPYAVQGPPNRAVYSSSGIMEEVVVTAQNLSGRISVPPASVTSIGTPEQLFALQFAAMNARQSSILSPIGYLTGLRVGYGAVKLSYQAWQQSPISLRQKLFEAMAESANNFTQRHWASNV